MSRIRMRTTLLLASAAIAVLALPATAHAATLYIKPSTGIGPVTLGMKTRTAVSYMRALVPLSASGRDTRYAGQTVYYYFFGKKLGTGRYQLEMYAKPYSGVSRIFLFQVNSAYTGSRVCATTKGIRVGSTESALKAAYPTATRATGSAGWYVYTLGDVRPTKFWVRYGKVQKITLQQ